MNPTLTRLQDRLPDDGADMPPPTIPPIPRAEQDTSAGQELVQKRSGLRIRLLIVDVIAVAGTWLLLGAMLMPATSANRRWVALFAAAIVTLGIMPLLGLYRTRLCVQRGQEFGRMVVAVVAGALAFELLLGHTGQSYAAVVVAGTCLLALIALRGLYGQWLRTQRAQGRFLRGLVMIGANEDASAVWTMLDSEPELGYEVRGVIGQPRDRPEWADLANGDAIEQIPEIARQTDSSGVLLVANALSAAEVHRVIRPGRGERPARSSLARVHGPRYAPRPSSPDEWRNILLCRTRTAFNVAIRSQESRRPSRGDGGLADLHTDPSRGLGCHPARE